MKWATKFFIKSKGLARYIFDTMFVNGWYSLETAEENKITKAYDEAKKEYGEL